MDAMKQFFQARATDLLSAKEFAEAAAAAKGMPSSGLPELPVLLTAAATLLAAWLLTLVTFSRKARRTLVEAVDTVLALILLLVLLGFVMGLPVAIVYLILKGVAFLLRTVLSVPALQPLQPLFTLFGV